MPERRGWIRMESRPEAEWRYVVHLVVFWAIIGTDMLRHVCLLLSSRYSVRVRGASYNAAYLTAIRGRRHPSLIPSITSSCHLHLFKLFFPPSRGSLDRQEVTRARCGSRRRTACLPKSHLPIEVLTHHSDFAPRPKMIELGLPRNPVEKVSRIVELE